MGGLGGELQDFLGPCLILLCLEGGVMDEDFIMTSILAPQPPSNLGWPIVEQCWAPARVGQCWMALSIVGHFPVLSTVRQR